MDGDKVRERIDSDQALADFLGVKVTPTLFINSRPLDAKDKNPRAFAPQSMRHCRKNQRTGHDVSRSRIHIKTERDDTI